MNIYDFEHIVFRSSYAKASGNQTRSFAFSACTIEQQHEASRDRTRPRRASSRHQKSQ